MSAVSLLTFLHVGTMFTAISLSLGPAILLRLAARSASVRVVQGVAEATAGLGRIIGPIFVLGGLFGLATAIVGGYDLLAPWLVIAYVLYAVGTGFGALGEGRWTADVARTAAANPETTPGPALAALLDSTRGMIAFWGFAAIVALLVFDMVVKPFS